MKKKFLFLILITIGFVFLSTFRVFATTSYKVDKNIDSIMDEIDEMVKTRSDKAFSSNPYDYTKNNKYYNNIVELGPEALSCIKEKIEDSEANGLKEYILAIAAEDISKTYLKGDSFKWEDSKGWLKEWNKHLKKVPSEVKRISKSNYSKKQKNEELVKLGICAIPYIIEEDTNELDSALIELANIETEEDSNIDKTKITNRYGSLKKMVEES